MWTDISCHWMSYQSSPVVEDLHRLLQIWHIYGELGSILAQAAGGHWDSEPVKINGKYNDDLFVTDLLSHVETVMHGGIS